MSSIASRVYIETPYNGTPEEIKRNVNYAQLAMYHSLSLGEAPFLSHLLYTQTPTHVGTQFEKVTKHGFVRDEDSDTFGVGRQEAIDAACAWRLACDKTVVYTDLGITRGMEYGIEHAKKIGNPIEYRSLESLVDLTK